MRPLVIPVKRSDLNNVKHRVRTSSEEIGEGAHRDCYIALLTSELGHLRLIQPNLPAIRCLLFPESDKDRAALQYFAKHHKQTYRWFDRPQQKVPDDAARFVRIINTWATT